MRSIVLLAVWLLIAAPVAAQDAPAPEPITLAEVLAAGRAGSPAIAAARSRERAAVAAAEVAGRWTNPAIEFRGENWGADVPGLGLDSFATVTQRLELGGKRGARRGAALAGAEMARVDAFATTRRIERELAGRFLETVRLRDRARILARQLDALAELVRVLERRVTEGFAPDAERARLAVETAAVSIAVTRAGAAAERAFLELRALAALPDGAAAAALVRPDPLPLPTGDPAQLAAGAAAERPDVRAAAGRVRDSGARAPSAELAPGPRPDGEHRPEAHPRHEHGRLRARGGAAGLRPQSGGGDARPRRGPRRGARTGSRDPARRSGRHRRAPECPPTAEAAAGAEAQLVEPATIARTAMRSAFDLGAADILLVVDAERAFADARLLANDIEIEAVAAAIAAHLALGEAPLP